MSVAASEPIVQAYHVIYSFDAQALPVYVGQMEVHIDAPPVSAFVASSNAASRATIGHEVTKR